MERWEIGECILTTLSCGPINRSTLNMLFIVIYSGVAEWFGREPIILFVAFGRFPQPLNILPNNHYPIKLLPLSMVCTRLSNYSLAYIRWESQLNMHVSNKHSHYLVLRWFTATYLYWVWNLSPCPYLPQRCPNAGLDSTKSFILALGVVKRRLIHTLVS